MNRQLLSARLADHGVRMAQRATAWYDAAYRRLAAAEWCEPGIWPHVDAQYTAHDVRATIAARYARMVSR